MVGPWLLLTTATGTVAVQVRLDDDGSIVIVPKDQDMYISAPVRSIILL